MKRALKLVPLGTLVAAFTAMAAPAEAANAPNVANVIQAPALSSARADPPALGYHGARTLVVGRVRTSVTTCQLKVLLRQSFPVVYASNAKRCHANFYAYVTIGANPTRVYRSVAFELIARNAAGQFSRGLLYIQVAPKGSTYVAASAPVVNTKPPPPAKSPPVPPAPWPAQMSTTQETTDNWSGYQVTGSNFTSVSGTFTVPSLQADETCQTSEALWVGIDGTGTGTSDLIQAGITETPYDDFGTCQAPTEFYIRAVREILPAPATDISSITANVGDRVTVNIWETPSPGYWTISVTDDTNGETFTTDQYYSGPGLSAEWITESATNATRCSGWLDGFANVCTETDYEPAVTYSGLDCNSSANVNAVTTDTMYQNGIDVSTPSAVSDLGQLLSNGFTTSYTGY